MTDLGSRDVTPYPKAAQVPPRKPRRTSASRERIAEIRAKKCDGPCRACNRYLPPIEAHHLIPRSLGGLWTESNIVGLCRGCHTGVEGRQSDTLARLREALTDAEYSYVVEKAGEGFLDRYYPVPRKTEGGRGAEPPQAASTAPEGSSGGGVG